MLALSLVAAFGLAFGVLGGTVAAAGTPTVSVATNAKLGSILVGPNGHTLYYFLKDTKNVDNCTGTCAGLWPPLTVSGTPTAGSGVTGALGTIQVSGSTIVTYNGWPLYYYSGDSAAGQTNGQGFLKLWYAATPTVSVAPLATATTTSTTKTSSTNTGSTSTSSTLPKTGSGPWPAVAGSALVLAGLGLWATRRRRAA